MKSALVINQTMLLILAVIALAIVIALWFTIGNPGASEMSNRLNLERSCNAYISRHPNCDYALSSSPTGRNEVTDVIDSCKKIPGFENVQATRKNDIRACCKIQCGG